MEVIDSPRLNTVQFLGFFNNSEIDCPKTVITVTNLELGNMAFKMEAKLSSSTQYEIQGKL